MIRYLLAHGADPAVTDRWEGTALDDVQRYGHHEVIALLQIHKEGKPSSG